MPIIYRKQLASGLYIRKFDVYINANSTGTYSDAIADADDPGRLQGNLDSNWSDEGPILTVNRRDQIDTGDTHVICGVIRPDVSGTWDFRLRCDDAGYLWVGFNAEALELDLDKGQALCQAGGPHGEDTQTSPANGSVTLTAGQLYAIKAMVGDRGGGDAFRISFSGPAGSQWESAVTNTGRDGTGFYFHNPSAPNGYNLDS